MSDVSPIVEKISVRELVESVQDRLALTPAGAAAPLDGQIETRLIQKTGLVLTGLYEFLQPSRIQILGRSEIRYLADLPDSGRAALEQLCAAEPPLVVVTRGLPVPAPLVEIAGQRGIPVFVTQAVTGETIEVITSLLDVRLAPRVRIHAVMMDLFGIGVLILGDSGIGKSECALELLSRGHRFVADDAVEIAEIGEELVARAPDLSRCHMEVRGLGIINARDMFGIGSVRDTKVIELVIKLAHFDKKKSWDRLGTGSGTWSLLGQEVPLRVIPVAAGRNLAVLIEAAVEQHLLRESGSDACHDLQAAVARRIAKRSGGGAT